MAGDLDLGPGRGMDFLAAYSWTDWAVPDDPEDPVDRWARDYRRLVQGYTARVVDVAPGSGVFLDAGCGLGRSTLDLAGQTSAPVLGLDMRIEALREGARVARGATPRWMEFRPGVGYSWRGAPDYEPSGSAAFALADVTVPPLAPGSVAGVLAANLLDSMDGPWRLLPTLRELMLPGAALALITPLAWPDTVIGAGPPGWTPPCSEATLVEALGASGFEPVDHPGICRWILRRHERERRCYTCHHLLAIRR